MIEHVTHDCICTGKFCKDCQVILCTQKFYTGSKYKNGLCTYCKKCHNIRTHNSNYGLATKKISVYQVEHVTSYCDCNGKICCDCKKELCEQKFYNKQTLCKLCSSVRTKKYYLDHKEYHYHKNLIKRQNFPEIDRIYSQKRRTLKNNLVSTFTNEQWKQLKQLYNYTCLSCGKSEPTINLEIDHIIPLSIGGNNNIDNIQPLCKSCNCSKGTKVIDYRNKK